MQGFWWKMLVWWYRLRGATATQAEWRARQARQTPRRARAELGAHVARAADARFNCACGQLLVEGDRTCHACGRRQWTPPGLRRLGRLLGVARPSATLGTSLAGATMLLGFGLQLKLMGTGALMGGSSPLALLEAGAWTGLVPASAQPWRALTYTFVHGGVMHLAFNGFALLQIGPAVERWFGFARFWLVWIGGGALGVLGPPLLGFGERGFVVGASGAVFGLIGAALMLGHRAGTTEGRTLRDMMIKWVVYATLFGFLMGGVAHSAHFGGLVAGVLVALLLPPAGSSPARRRLTPAVAAVALGAFLAGVGGFLGWHLAGAMPPAAVGPAMGGEWLELKADRDGLSAVLPPPAVALLAEAERARQAGAAGAEAAAVVEAGFGAVAPGLTPAQRVLMQRRVFAYRRADGLQAEPGRPRRDAPRPRDTASPP